MAVTDLCIFISSEAKGSMRPWSGFNDLSPAPLSNSPCSTFSQNAPLLLWCFVPTVLSDKVLCVWLPWGLDSACAEGSSFSGLVRCPEKKARSLRDSYIVTAWQVEVLPCWSQNLWEKMPRSPQCLPLQCSQYRKLGFFFKFSDSIQTLIHF